MTIVQHPTAVDEAVAALAASPDALVYAGCTDLLVAGTARTWPACAISLRRVAGLRGIRATDTGCRIGAATTFAEIRRSALLAEHLPTLVQAAAVVGGWQIQNRATLGGNAANASPAGDSLPVLLAVDAVVVAAGPAGERRVPYDRFHLGYRRTALLPGEIIVGFEIPHPAAGTLQRFRKLGPRRAQAISKVVVALTAAIDGNVVRSARLAAGSVGPTPLRLEAAEQALVGERLTPALARAIGELAAAGVTPIDDVRSTAAYRRFALARVVERLVLELNPPVAHSNDGRT